MIKNNKELALQRTGWMVELQRPITWKQKSPKNALLLNKSSPYRLINPLCCPIPSIISLCASLWQSHFPIVDEKGKGREGKGRKGKGEGEEEWGRQRKGKGREGKKGGGDWKTR